nr:MAG: putative capsid protein [Arizlama virus]
MKRKYSEPPMLVQARKRQKSTPRRQGLVASYPGWNPRNFPSGELKYSDVTMAAESDTTGAIALLNGLRLGNAATQRVGQQIKIKSLQFNLNLNNDQAAARVVRTLVVCDRQTNATALTVLQVLDAISTISNKNLTNRKRFKIYYDKRRSVAPTGNEGSVIPVNKYIKFRRPITVDYNTADNGTVADITTNSLYMITVGDVANPNGCQFSAQCRIRYSDD